MQRLLSKHQLEAELQLAKEQAVCSVLLSLESSGARVGALARQEIIHGRRIAPDQIINAIEAVTRDDVQQVARSCFKSNDLAVGALGNLNGFAIDRSRLEI